MADIAPTANAVTLPGSWDMWEWTPVTNADTFLPCGPGASARDMVVEVTGTFGGATIVLQGSMDGTNWYGVNNLDGSAISLTGAGSSEVRTSWPRMRFNASGGDGTQSLTARLARARG